MTKIRKNSWFIEGEQHNRQVGLYKLFVEKKDISVETLISLIYKFKEIEYNKLQSNKARRQLERKSYLLLLISDKFEEFLSLVTQETGVQFNINKKKQRKEQKDYAEFADMQFEASMYGHITSEDL